MIQAGLPNPTNPIRGNGRICHDPRYSIQCLTHAVSNNPAMIPILYDAAGLLAIEKPAGLATQSPPGTDSLENRLREQLADRTSYIAFPHRLDRPVSGVILVATTKRAARLLSDQFATRKTAKTYLAWVHGKACREDLHWQDWLRKIPDVARVETCDESADSAKHAETHVELVHFDDSANRSLLRLKPITGRMHQLRIQAASRGHAIVGDQQYGSSIDLVPDRIMLHAESITFHDPKSGRRTTVECPNGEFGGSQEREAGSQE